MSNKEDIIKTSAYRLRQIIIFSGAKSANLFADSIGADQSELSRILSGKRDLSAAFAYKIVKKHKDVSFEWLIDGDGEMLNTEKTPGESWPLGAEEGYFFPSNLSVLIEMLKIDNLPSLIPLEQQIITDLIAGSRRPSVALLVRLRQVLGVPLDALLLSDLRLPENMEHLKNTQQPEKPEGLGEVQKTLEAILARMEEMKKAQERMESEVERLKEQKEAQQLKGP